MKIPLALSDFEAGGFRKIAKFISNKWPIPDKNPSLSEAQKILSRILGYNDLHDAMKSAGAAVSLKNWSDDFELEVSHKLYSMIYDGVAVDVITHHFQNIEIFTREIPVRHLTFFKENPPEVEATQEEIDLVVRLYSEDILSHSYYAKTDIHSLPGAVSNCLSIINKESSTQCSYTIREALAAVTLENGTRMTDFVKSDIHEKSLRNALSEFRSYGALSPYNIKPRTGFSHLKYFKALDNPANLKKFDDAASAYLEACMDRPTDSLYIESFKNESLMFSAELFDMRHSILIDDDLEAEHVDVEIEEEHENETLSDDYMRQMASLKEKAENALQHCKVLDTRDGREEFGIFFRNPDSDLSFDFYRWYLLKKDNQGKQVGYATGIAFSQNSTRTLVALDLKDAASESEEDENHVMLTINEHRKGLSPSYSYLPIDEIRVGSITKGTPLIIVQKLKKAFDETDYSGRGLNVLMDAVERLKKFFGSNISLSIKIEPSQFINEHVSPHEIKMQKNRYAEELSRYFAERLKGHRELGIKILLLPTFSSK